MERLTLIAGARGSTLSLVQATDALDRIQALCPGLAFDLQPLQSPGDRDQATDLRDSPADFFTQDLDHAVRTGRLDLAVHSAKDCPDPVSEGLDVFWLPWRADRRDAWVCAPGLTLDQLPGSPRIGVSSERREAYAQRCFPGASMLPLRGHIEQRLARLDAGAFDAILMARAALDRLGLSDRITHSIPLDELDTPEGQGALAVTFRAGDTRLQRLRALFVYPVILAGAGSGAAEHCSVAVKHAISRCDICLYDALVDERVLEWLAPGAKAEYVGKRGGRASTAQDALMARMMDACCKGKRVVRLKGGDPGLFGRLAEEIDALEGRALPYRVLPGISSMIAATTGTGMLLTRRGESRGFTALTPRLAGGGTGSIGRAMRDELPLVFFMSRRVAGDVAEELMAEGRPGETPVALIHDAGGANERVVRTVLSELDNAPAEAPVLILVGSAAGHAYRQDAGALQGRRLLITCSDVLQHRMGDLVRDYGGVPVGRPLVRLCLDDAAVAVVARLLSFDWIVLTSPSAVRCLAESMGVCGADIRDLPPIMSCGPGTSRELQRLRLVPAVQPTTSFGTDGLLEEAAVCLAESDRILRLRSDRAGTALADGLRHLGADVEDVVLYRNEPVSYVDPLPLVEAVHFASASAVDAFVASWGIDALPNTVLAMGQPTAAALRKYGIDNVMIGSEATLESAVRAWAGMMTVRDILAHV